MGKKFLNTEKAFQDFLLSHYEKMQFEELNFDKFEEAFKSLKWNKVAGFDDLSNKIIIDAYNSLINILFHVFMFLSHQGIFPEIFKSGDKDNINNYHPTSIFSIFSKVLERIMYNRVIII